MSKPNFLTNSLKILKLKGKQGISAITQAYLDLTHADKFRKVFILNEELREEFIKYHEAYVIAIRELSNIAAEATPEYYPPGQIINLLFNQGLYQLLKENYLMAGEKLDKAGKMDNKDVLIKIYLGIVLKKRKNYYAAEDYFLKAIELDRENEYSWFFLGKNYLKAGKLDKASAAFRKVETLSFYNNEIIAETRDAFREIERIRLKNEKKSIISRILKK
ncbi:MAG: hypothetical protein ABFR36_10225 [Acidobacteriota bacterium]